MILDNPNLDYIKSIYKNTKLKKIVNVYQKKYINIKGQGFGDFLRGSIYLTYICLVLGLDFDIDIKNHPMSMYLNNNISLYNINYSNIEPYICYDNNETNFIINFIKKLNNYNEEIFYLFNNSQPLFNIANPKFNIIQKARNIIIPKIEPKKNVLDILDNKLDMCNLKRKKYGVIHIRAGDYFMNIQKNVDSHKHQISFKHINDIITFISLYCSRKKKYIVVGDSDKIKRYITAKFSNLIMFDTKITHLGESNTNDNTSILDTFIDFNIIRFSNFIISFSGYGHGSCFSDYCAKLYNIPYNKILLEPILSYNI